MSKQKKLRNRLENLFADLEQEVTAPASTGEEPAPGWMWECNAEGLYTSCSPEVSEALGFPPQDFLEQPVTRFALDSESADRLKTIMESGVFPAEATLRYRCQNGRLIPVRVSIIQVGTRQNGLQHWRGFNQVMPEEARPPQAEAVEKGQRAQPPTDGRPPSPPQPQRRPPNGFPTRQGFTRPVSSPYAKTGTAALFPKQVIAIPGSKNRAATLTIPVTVQNQELGVMEILDKTPDRKWTEDEQLLAQQVADQLSLALENANLFNQTQKRALQLETAAEVSKAASSILDVEQLLNNTVDLIRERFALYYVGIFLVDPTGKWAVLRAGTGEAGRQQLANQHKLEVGGSSMIGQCVLHGEARISQMAGEESVRFQNPYLPETRSEMALPLRAPGQTIGAMTIQSEQEQAFRPEDITSLQTMADQLANAIQNAGLFEQSRQFNEELVVLNEMSRVLATTLEIEKVVENVYEYTSRLIKATSYVIALYNAKIDEVSFPVVAEHGERLHLPPRRGGDGLTEYVLHNRKPLLIKENNPANFETLGITQYVVGDETQSWLGVPITYGREILGMISVQSTTTANLFTERHLDLLTAIANQSAIAIQNAHLFQETQDTLAETNLLYQANADLNTIQSYQDILTVLMKHTLLGEGQVSISLFDRPWLGDDMPDWAIPVIRSNVPEEGLDERYNLKSMPTTKILQHDQITLIEDVATDTRLDAAVRALYSERLKAKSVLFVPLVAGGQMVGYINAIYPEPIQLNEKQRRQLMALAGQSTIAIERIRLLMETRRRAAQLQTAAEIARDTSEALTQEDLLKRAVNLIVERFGFYHASIFLLDETRQNAVVRQSTGNAGTEMMGRNHTLAVGSQSIIGNVTFTGNPLVINDTEKDPIHRPNPLLPETRSELGIPLKIGQTIIGALDVQSTKIGAFSPDDVAVLQTLADQIAIALENARLYEEQQETAAQLRELDRLKNQFLANMSHELRTPLNSIIGFSRVILKGIDGPISETQQQDLTAIYNAGQHLLGLINDILDLSRIEAGKMELNFEAVDIGELINSVMSTARGLVKEKPVKLEVQVSPELPKAYADNTRVRQVLLNLIQNAAKFTEEGQISVSANPQIGENGRPEIIVKVTDTGAGISLEDQNKLFQPFSQVDASPTRATGGTGLGLSICRNLIELHGGIIDVDSTIGEGSTFYFTLPVVASNDEIPGLEGSERKTVLAIDDDPQVLKLYQRYLYPEGYQVVSLTDPQKAVEIAQKLKPFAITLDVMMPNLDGWDVIKALKAHPETRDIPVIFCTILEDPAKGFKLGAADYLMKPILKEDLINALSRLDANGSIQKVLVVDDDPEVLRLVQKILDVDEKYQVRVAEGGQEGLAAMHREVPDALILDLMMPKMDGFQVLEEMQNDPALKAVPVIILTGADLSREQQELLAAFTEDMLKKGVLDEYSLLECLKQSRTPSPAR